MPKTIAAEDLRQKVPDHFCSLKRDAFFLIQVNLHFTIEVSKMEKNCRADEMTCFRLFRQICRFDRSRRLSGKVGVYRSYWLRGGVAQLPGLQQPLKADIRKAFATERKVPNLFRRANGQDAHAGPLGGFNSWHRVLNNNASRRRQVEASGRQEENVGRGLSASFAAIGYCVDFRQQTDGFQYPSRIAAGRSDRQGHPPIVEIV